MKKFLCMVCMVLLLVGLCSTALAVGPAVIDQADLFSAEEEARLTTLVEQFREKNQMDFGIVTSSDPHHGITVEEVADGLYDRGGYGMGADNSGILYYIDMYERIPHLTTTGAMINRMTDARIESAHDLSYTHLVDGDYAQAAEKILYAVDYFLNEAPYGSSIVEMPKDLNSGEILLAVVIAGVVALVYVFSVNHGYSLKGNTYDYDFRNNSAVELTGQTDDYLRTTTVRTRKAPPPSSGSSGGFSRGSGSSTHISRSGTTHGGGSGRRF